MNHKTKAERLRRNIWRSLAILRTITTLDLMGTIEGLGYDRAKKAVRQLEIHGYVEKVGNRKTGHQRYMRSRETALLPAFCEACGASFTAMTCNPSASGWNHSTAFRGKGAEQWQRERQD